MKQLGLKNRGLVYILLVVLQLAVCVGIAFMKKSYFCDEIYSYGLANCEYSFVNVDMGLDSGWIPREVWADYPVLSQEHPWSFVQCVRNQIQDVHPPVYYILLHFFCLLFGMDSLSIWPGICLNLAVLVLVDVLLFRIAMFFLKDRKLGVLSVALWSMSAAGLSNILFIRMYLLLTCVILLFLYLNILYFGGNRSSMVSVGMFLVPLVGCLIHYYFIIFCLYFCAAVCLYFLCHKRVKDAIAYGQWPFLGALSAVGIFPVMVHHIFFGYKGQQCVEKFAENGWDFWWSYLSFVNRSFFGGFFFLFLGVFLIWVWRHRKSCSCELSLEKRAGLLFFMVHVAFVITVAALANVVDNRYIYCVYPMLAVGTVYGIYRILGSYRWCILLSVIFCMSSIFVNGVDHLYLWFPDMAASVSDMQGTDCLIYCDSDFLGYADVYTLYQLRLMHDETFYLLSEQIPGIYERCCVQQLPEILSKRETMDPVVCCFAGVFSDEEVQNIVAEFPGVSGCEPLYRITDMSAWWLYLVE